MPFQYILANLLAQNRDAVGVIFLDDNGEAVDFAAAELAPFDLQLVGAQMGIYLRRIRAVTAASALGDPDLVHVERDGLHLHAVSLPDGYLLALLQRRPALVATARASLRRAARELRREVFSA